MTRTLALLVAIGPGGIIGRGGALPWHLPEDLRHFKAMTLGHAIVMGRKTWESIGRPLPRRRSIVLSRQPGFRAAGAEVASSLEQALARAWEEDPSPRIIGGAGLYAAALPQVTSLFITEVEALAAGEAATPREGDVLFPPFERAAFREVAREAGQTPGITFTELLRLPLTTRDAP